MTDMWSLWGGAGAPKKKKSKSKSKSGKSCKNSKHYERRSGKKCGSRGSRRQVMFGSKKCTSGGLKKADIKVKSFRRNGKVVRRFVSQRASTQAKQRHSCQMRDPDFAAKWNANKFVKGGKRRASHKSKSPHKSPRKSPRKSPSKKGVRRSDRNKGKVVNYGK